MLRRTHLLKIVATIALGIAATIAVVVFLDRPPSPGRATQAILDGIVPGLVIGEHVPVETRQRLGLTVLPYSGLTAQDFRDSLGLRKLVVVVDEYVDDARPMVSPSARIESLMFVVSDSARFAPMLTRLDAALGAPTTSCYMVVNSETIVRQRRWRAEHGRVVLLRNQIVPALSTVASDSTAWGWIQFSGREGELAIVTCPPT